MSELTAEFGDREPAAAQGRIETYSLAEVAAEHLPAEIKDPVRWLAMRLNRGELRGVRLGRYWRMRDSDIEYMLERYSNDVAVGATKAAAPKAISIVEGMSERSRRRVGRLQG